MALALLAGLAVTGSLLSLRPAASAPSEAPPASSLQTGSRVPAGQRAVAVPVLTPGIVEGLSAGRRVDVIASGSGQVVASDAVVLSVANSTPTGGRFEVVVAVSPEEAAAVAKAVGSPAGPTGFVVATRP